MCRCFVRGLTTAPPHAEHVRVNDEGCVELDLPWENHRSEHRAFDEWMYAACAHESMEVATERISNWSGYRMFQEAIGDVGWDHFPTLRAVLPNANGGSASPLASKQCLDELQRFEAAYEAEVAALFDSETGDVLHDYIRSYEGIFFYGGRGGLNVGVDERGLFVREREGAQRELFLARRIEQRPVMLGGEEAAELVDLDSNATLVVELRIHGKAIPWPDGRMQNDDGRWRFAEPARMHVAPHKRTAASFEGILSSLRNVFSASVDTGNPVRWL
jgi:hypothetical protein